MYTSPCNLPQPKKHVLLYDASIPLDSANFLFCTPYFTTIIWTLKAKVKATVFECVKSSCANHLPSGYPDRSFTPIPKFDDRSALQKHSEPKGIFNLTKFTNLGIEAIILGAGTGKLDPVKFVWFTRSQYPIHVSLISSTKYKLPSLHPLPVFLSFARKDAAPKHDSWGQC
jgi:hypothetical protein